MNNKIDILHKNNRESNEITRECIENALIELMKKKKFEDITITDICEKAGVSRTSYYRNYESKDDILSEYIHSINDELSNTLLKYNAIDNTKESWVALLTKAKELSSKFKILINANCGEKIMMEVAKSMNKYTSKENKGLYYSNIYWSGSIVFVLEIWIINNFDISINELAEIASNMMLNGIHTIKEYGNQCE